MKFNNRLKEWRLKRKLSQNQLAEMASVSRTIIIGLEKGTVSAVRSDTILKLAHALSVPVHKIFFTP